MHRVTSLVFHNRIASNNDASWVLYKVTTLAPPEQVSILLQQAIAHGFVQGHAACPTGASGDLVGASGDLVGASDGTRLLPQQAMVIIMCLTRTHLSVSVLPQQAIAHGFAREALKTLSKTLIALGLLANVQALIAEEVKNQCLSEDGQVLTDPMQNNAGDCLYGFQWHLSGKAFGRGESHNEFNTNSSTNTVHLNVAEVWKKYKGEGTYIAILEGNLNIIHPDLDDNIASDYNHNYDVNNTDANFLSHTIAVAGVAAARGYNGIGVRGVAPLAKMFILSNWEQDDDDHIAAMTIHREITAVSNNSYSWGFFRHLSSMWYLALETGINEGFHGKGTVYVFSAGNDGDEGYNSNYSPYTNYHAVIAVCGVDYRGKHNDYSESGANLWVCALDRDEAEKYGIVTTDRPNPGSDSISNDRYDIAAAGTSFSAPMVSGIVALMRQANSNLSWRDVKVILANSAVKTDSDDKGWRQSGMKYRSFSDRYYFNHKYGFGLVDAKAAVDLAEEWVNLPPREKDAVVKEEVNSTTPTISRSLIVKSDIDFIEHVDATIDFSIDQTRDLSIELISPSGTTSTLASLGNNISNTLDVKWRFGSSRHLGEPASGVWRLIAQSVGKEKGKNIAERRLTITLRSWELRIRGYQVKLEAVAAENLSDLNVATDDSLDSPPLTLSLRGALWKDTLEPSDFILRKAPKNLSIASVERTSSTQVQLKLKLTGKLDKAYDFQVVATTGTVSNRATPLISNDVEIARIAYNKEAVIPQGTKGFYYEFTAGNILSSPTTLTYAIKVVKIVGEDETEMDLGELGFTQNGPIISGTPKIAGEYQFRITATREPGISRMIVKDFSILYTLQTQIKVYPEGLLSE